MSEILFLLAFASTAQTLATGFLVGLWHAHEADHLAAVSTIVAERKNLWSAAFVGGMWGLGHTLALLAAGVFVLLLDFQISERSERILETCVGVMLVLLGLNVLRKIVFGGATLHAHAHAHGGRTHSHPHVHEANEIQEAHTHHGFSFNPRAVVIGMIHGLAGSAAVMLLFLPTIESRTLGFVYLALFGIGSIGGMMLMSLLVGLPFHFTAARFNRFNSILQSVAGIISVGLGFFIIYEKVLVEGLIG